MKKNLLLFTLALISAPQLAAMENTETDDQAAQQQNQYHNVFKPTFIYEQIGRYTPNMHRAYTDNTIDRWKTMLPKSEQKQELQEQLRRDRARLQDNRIDRLWTCGERTLMGLAASLFTGWSAWNIWQAPASMQEKNSVVHPVLVVGLAGWVAKESFYSAYAHAQKYKNEGQLLETINNIGNLD